MGSNAKLLKRRPLLRAAKRVRRGGARIDSERRPQMTADAKRSAAHPRYDDRPWQGWDGHDPDDEEDDEDDDD